MTDAPAADLRQEQREQLILDAELVIFLATNFGFNQTEITAVSTYCFWLRYDLPTTSLCLEDLVTVMDNTLLTQWVRRNHPHPHIGRLERLCHDFVIQSSLVIDQLIYTDPNLEVHP